MIPMRRTRILIALPALVAVAAALEHLSGWIGPSPSAQRVLSAILTAGLLFSYAWIAPWIYRFLASAPAEPERQDAAHGHGHADLASSLQTHARTAGIVTPKLFLIDHDAPTAFGIGLPTSSTVFITTGFCRRVDAKTVSFALAHEVAHVAQRHCLFQAIVFAGLYLLKSLAGLPILLALPIILGYLAFLRQCEYAADRQAMDLVGRDTAAHALRRLGSVVGDDKLPKKPLGNFSNWWIDWIDWMRTHPNFERRAKAAQEVEGDGEKQGSA